MKRVELSVVVLCYKSERFILEFCHQLLNELQSLNVSFEIVLVANYDDDDDQTPQLATSLEQQFDEVTALKKRKAGKMGWDMRLGLEKANGDYIAVIDGDGQMPSSDISTVYQIIKKEEYDLVKTYRKSRFDGVYRRVLSAGYNFLFNLLFQPPKKLKDVNAKPKILTRKALDQLQLSSNDWFTDAEIMIQALNLDMQIYEVATVFEKNERRASFVTITTIFEFVANLITYKFFK